VILTFSISISLLIKSIDIIVSNVYLYLIDRLKKIKSIYWFNDYFFSKNFLKKFITKAELYFLKSYCLLLWDYSRQLTFDICEILPLGLRKLSFEFKVTKKCSVETPKDSFLLSKLSIYFLPFYFIKKIKKRILF